MEKGLLKHIMMISGIISHQFADHLIRHLGSNYFKTIEVIADLTYEVHKNLEPSIDSFDEIEYLDNVVRETKHVLLHQYKVNLIVNGPQ